MVSPCGLRYFGSGLAIDESLVAVVARRGGAWLSMTVIGCSHANSFSGSLPDGVIARQGCDPSLHASRAETRLTVYRAHRSSDQKGLSKIVVSGSEK